MGQKWQFQREDIIEQPLSLSGTLNNDEKPVEPPLLIPLVQARKVLTGFTLLKIPSKTTLKAMAGRILPAGHMLYIPALVKNLALHH